MLSGKRNQHRIWLLLKTILLTLLRRTCISDKRLKKTLITIQALRRYRFVSVSAILCLGFASTLTPTLLRLMLGSISFCAILAREDIRHFVLTLLDSQEVVDSKQLSNVFNGVNLTALFPCRYVGSLVMIFALFLRNGDIYRLHFRNAADFFRATVAPTCQCDVFINAQLPCF